MLLHANARLCPVPSLIVSAYPFPPFLGADPIKLFTSAVVRKAPRSLGAHVKSLNYLDGIVAKQQAGAVWVVHAMSCRCTRHASSARADASSASLISVSISSR